MASDFTQRAKQTFKSTFQRFLLLTLTQQGLIVIFLLLFIAILRKSLLSLFWVYSFALIGFTFAWFKWQNRQFRPMSAEPHLVVIDFIKETIEIARTVLLVHRELSTSNSGRRTKDLSKTVLSFDHELSMFIEAFTADFIDTWFVEVAADPALKSKLVEILRVIGDDVVDRVSRLDREKTVSKVLRVYQTYLFQINEAKKSLRTKSLYDSNRRLKRVHTLEDAFEINFGLHPVVRSLITCGGVVSDKSPLKKPSKRKSTNSLSLTSSSSTRRHTLTQSSSITNPVDPFDYFYSLIGLLVELQMEKDNGGRPLRVSRLTQEALADVVTSGVLPILPKFVDPAFLYECVSDLLAPPSLETFAALVDAEERWLEARVAALMEPRIAVEDSSLTSPFESSVMLTPVDRDMYESVSSQISITDSVASDAIDGNTLEIMPEITRDIGDDKIKDRPHTPNHSFDLSRSISQVSDDAFKDDSPVIQPMTVEPSSQRPIDAGSIEISLDGSSMSGTSEGQNVEAETEPTLSFSQFGDFVDISLSTSALTAFQQEALNDALGVSGDEEKDDPDTVETRVEAATFDISNDDDDDDDDDGRSNLDVDDIDSNEADSPRDPPPAITVTHATDDSVKRHKSSEVGSWDSCPDLVSTKDSELGNHSRRSTGSTAGDYDCFSVGELPREEPSHFKPHLFSPALEPAAGTFDADSNLGSSNSNELVISGSLMDRLFLSIMIPETVLCRDPHSGIKYTLYVIHYTAVYPCGPGGALEPRAGAAKRRFREFLTLHERLENSNSFKYSLTGIKGPSKWMGPFPWTNFDKDLIETRRKALEAYLKNLVAKTDISCSQPLREFLAYDADPRIAYVQKAPNYSNLFRLDRFFTKGLKGSIEEVFASNAKTAPTPPHTSKLPTTALQKGDNESPSLQEGRPENPAEYHLTGSKDVYIKTASPLLRGKDLSGNSSAVSSPRSQSPNTVSSTTVTTTNVSNIANNLTLAAHLMCDEEQLLRKGLLDIQFSTARPALHVPFGPHLGWGPRGKKQQLRYQNYRLKHSTLEKQCDFHAIRRSEKVKKEDDLEDLLFPKNVGLNDDDEVAKKDLDDDEDVFFDVAEESFEDGRKNFPQDVTAPLRDTLLLDAIVDIVFEAMRFHPTWINHELLLNKFKLVFGAVADHLVSAEIGDVTTRSRWAYYLGLIRITLWPAEEAPPVARDANQTRSKAFRDLIKFFPIPMIDCLGSEEVQSAIDAIFDSVSNCHLNLHFILTIMELLLQELYPEKDFLSSG